MTALVLAYGAGLLATVNPCGFIMLPTFVACSIGELGGEHGLSPAARVRRGLATGAALTAGFAAVFVVAGAGLTLGFRLLARVIPWLAVGIGGVLFIIGMLVALGQSVRLNVGAPRQHGNGRGLGSIIAFGAAYAVASLSCTVAIFLALLAQALATTSVLGLAAVLALYVAGSATVLVSVSLSAALAQGSIARRLRRLLPLVSRSSGVLLAASGAYLIAFWLPQLMHPGTFAPDWLTGVPQAISSQLSGLLAEHQLAIGVLATAAVALSVGVGGRSHRHNLGDSRRRDGGGRS